MDKFRDFCGSMMIIGIITIFIYAPVGLCIAGIFAVILMILPAESSASNQKKSAPKTTRSKPVQAPKPPVQSKTKPKTSKKSKSKAASKDFNKLNIQVPGAPAVDAYAYAGSQKDYFRLLLTNAFPGYSLRTNVHLDELNTAQTSGASGWTCSCGAYNTTSFCGSCGKAKPAPKPSASWTCACGACNTTPFCGSCGKRRPAVNSAPPVIKKPKTAFNKYEPISYLLCRDGQPKLAIMLGDRYYRVQYCKDTIKVLNDKGIPVQFYIDTFRNKASYVYSRVQSELN